MPLSINVMLGCVCVSGVLKTTMTIQAAQASSLPEFHKYAIPQERRLFIQHPRLEGYKGLAHFITHCRHWNRKCFFYIELNSSNECGLDAKTRVRDSMLANTCLQLSSQRDGASQSSEIPILEHDREAGIPFPH